MFFIVHIISDFPYKFSTGIEMFFNVHSSDFSMLNLLVISFMHFKREFKCFAKFILFVISLLNFNRNLWG